MTTLRRNLWPLPGGAHAYATNLRLLIEAVGTGVSRAELESVVSTFAPTVQSTSTLRGYAAVPITLGFVERRPASRLALTTTGKRYARSGNLSLVREALITRVLGIEELLDELASSPATCPVLITSLADRGISWNHPMAVRYRVWWLVSAGAVEATRHSRADLLSLTRAGKKLLR